jgi:hypothetical protein
LSSVSSLQNPQDLRVNYLGEYLGPMLVETGDVAQEELGVLHAVE